MTILLLGADGFVGTNMAKLLDKANMPYIQLKGKKETDLRDTIATHDYFKKIRPDILINCAAHVGSLNYVTSQAGEVIVDNARMIMAMYEGLAKVNPDCLVINPIANCAYPAVDEKFEEDNLWKGPLHTSVLAYGGAKRFLLNVAKSFEMQYNIKSILLLVPNMYGPYDSTDPNKAHALNALISRFVKAEMTKATDITLWGTGVAIREWLYADDFGRIVLSIIQNQHMLGLAEPVNIAQNFGLSVKELVQVIQAHFKKPVAIKWDAGMPDGAPKKVMDDNRFKKLFPVFQFTDFNQGIETTIEYYRRLYPY